MHVPSMVGTPCSPVRLKTKTRWTFGQSLTAASVISLSFNALEPLSHVRGADPLRLGIDDASLRDVAVKPANSRVGAANSSASQHGHRRIWHHGHVDRNKVSFLHPCNLRGAALQVPWKTRGRTIFGLARFVLPENRSCPPLWPSGIKRRASLSCPHNTHGHRPQSSCRHSIVGRISR